MTLEELEKTIKNYKCNSLKDKEVCLKFVSNTATSYIEDIVAIKYDANHKRFLVFSNNERPEEVTEEVLI